jgi:hypothetical protein
MTLFFFERIVVLGISEESALLGRLVKWGFSFKNGANNTGKPPFIGKWQ